MVRSFALIGFSYLIALMASVYFGATVAIELSIVFLCLFIISLFFKKCRSKKVIPIVLITMSIAFINYGISYIYKVVPIEKLDKTTVNISGVICDTPYKSYNKYYYILKTDSVGLDGAPQNIKIRVSSNTSLDADIYDKVTAQVNMFLPNDSNGFSSKAYYASKNIHMFAYFNNYESVKIDENSNKSINYYILKFRSELISRIKILLGQEESSIAIGMLLGYKFDINSDVKTDFNRVGISHLLAVSGYHMAVIVSFMFTLFGFLKCPKKLSNVLTIFVVILFMALTGFSSSIVRSGIMYIVYLFGSIISRRTDSLNSLGLATFLICVLNPFSAGDIGLLLSVSATLGIIILSPVISLWFKNKITNVTFGKSYLYLIIDILAVTLSANLFTMPITMLSFKYFYIISPLANILIIFAFSAMMFCLIIAIVLSYLGFLSIMAIPFSIASTLLIKYMVTCAKVLADLPYAYLSANYKFLLLWLAGTFLLLAVAIFLRKDLKLIKITAILSVMILMIGTLSYQILKRNITTVAILNTGTGISAVASKNGHAAVISCGGEDFYSDSIYEYLESRNIKKLDFVLASDDNSKTSGFIENIINKYNPASVVVHDKVLDDNKELFKSKLNSRNNLITFETSADVDIWNNISISAVNESSESFIYLTVNDVKFLFCPSGGDAYNLPIDWKTPTFAIYGNIPDNDDMIKSNYIILTMSEDDLKGKTKPVVVNNKNVFTTSMNDMILIDCIGNNEISIHR